MGDVQKDDKQDDGTKSQEGAGGQGADDTEEDDKAFIARLKAENKKYRNEKVSLSKELEDLKNAGKTDAEKLSAKFDQIIKENHTLKVTNVLEKYGISEDDRSLFDGLSDMDTIVAFAEKLGKKSTDDAKKNAGRSPSDGKSKSGGADEMTAFLRQLNGKP